MPTTSTTLRTPRPCSDSASTAGTRTQQLDEEADQHRVRQRPHTDVRAQAPGDREHEDPDDDVRRPVAQRLCCSARPWWSTSHGERPSSDSSRPDDAGGAQEEAEDEGQDARAEAAAEDRRRPHVLGT